MSEINTPEAEASVALPLLPLSSGVVLPQMFVTLALESPEARDAAAAARVEAADGRVLLVPKVGSGYATVGTIARVENHGELPSGQPALVLRGLARAKVGAVVANDEPGLWVTAELVSDRAEVTGPGQGPDARVPRRGARDRARSSVRRASPTRSRASTTPARSPTPWAGRPT